jgi:hypothetical protein
VKRLVEGKAVNIFYKEDDISARQLHDDAYARMLDKLSSVDCQRMFETICLTERFGFVVVYSSKKFGHRGMWKQRLAS